MSRNLQQRRGVSLIEALVAMTVMAFGMLGVIGLQATLRTNADLAKQRSEAVRIAQETLEQWRRFSVLANDADHLAADFPNTFAGIADLASTTITGYTTNATYTRVGDITESTPPGQKTLVVDVSWVDRGGTTQNVRLFSNVAKVSPEFSATLVAPPGGGVSRTPGGRSRGIPPQAKNFGDGTSGYRPPGQGAGAGVAWLFSNTTGLITQICTTTVTDNALLVRTDLTSCVDTTPAQLITGFVRFWNSTTQPAATDVSNPTGALSNTPPEAATLQVQVLRTAPGTLTVDCFEDYASNYIQYFCAVPVAAPADTWSGSLQVSGSLLTLSPNIASNSAAERKVCRYRAAASYTNAGTPLSNENLILIHGGSGSGLGFTCPSPPTWPHQPAT